MILYGAVAGVSVGKLFIGGVFPGLLLTTLFILYIGIRSLVQKNLCPSMPKEQRIKITFKEKFARVKSVFFPSVLIIAVLGSIFAGIATPTEAAAVGALGSLISAVMNRRLSWQALKEACYRLRLLEDAACFMQTILSAGKKIRYLSSAQMEAVDRLEAEDYRKLLIKRK